MFFHFASGFKEMSEGKIVECRVQGNLLYNVQSNIYGNLTCQSNVLRCLSVLRPAYSDLCHTERSSNQHRMDGYPEKEN